MRFSVIIVSLFLFMSMFAVNVLAQDDEVESSLDSDVVEAADVISSDEVEILEEEEVDEVLPEYEEVEEPEEVKEAEKRAIFGLTRVTIGEGFVVKDDESDAEFFRGIWVVKRLIERTGNLEEAENQEIKSKKFGFVVIGVAEEKEKFRLEMTDFSEESIKFDLKDNTGAVVGSMEIKPKRYPRLTLWFGSLTLNSGSYAGTWDVTAVSKTKVIKPRIKRAGWWNIFAFRQRRETKIKEKLEEKLFEREGLGKFIRENKGRDLRKIKREKRKVVIDRKERLEKRRLEVAERLKTRNKVEMQQAQNVAPTTPIQTP